MDQGSYSATEKYFAVLPSYEVSDIWLKYKIPFTVGKSTKYLLPLECGLDNAAVQSL